MYQGIVTNKELTGEDNTNKKKKSEVHAELVNISREAFEVEFPKQINDEFINNYLRQSVERNYKELVISIGWDSMGHFLIENAVLDYFYKYSVFGIFHFGQTKLKHLQIKDLIKRAKYEREIRPLPQEIIENSKVLEVMIFKLKESGYMVEVHHENGGSKIIVHL